MLVAFKIYQSFSISRASDFFLVELYKRQIYIDIKENLIWYCATSGKYTCLVFLRFCAFPKAHTQEPNIFRVRGKKASAVQFPQCKSGLTAQIHCTCYYCGFTSVEFTHHSAKIAILVEFNVIGNERMEMFIRKLLGGT